MSRRPLIETQQKLEWLMITMNDEFLINKIMFPSMKSPHYNTPPTESMSGLQPNTPQPLTPGFPHRRWVVASGDRTQTWPLTPLARQKMLPVALQHNWWHLWRYQGVKGQVWGSIPTGNNPPAMKESRGEGMGCIGLQTWHVAGPGVAPGMLYSQVHKAPYHR